MTRSLAVELGPKGIRVNAVAPGVVDTALWAKNKAIPGVVEGIEQQTPLRRWAVAEDIADVIVFLASDAAPHDHGRDDLRRRRHGAHARPLRRRRVSLARSDPFEKCSRNRTNSLRSGDLLGTMDPWANVRSTTQRSSTSSMPHDRVARSGS